MGKHAGAIWNFLTLESEQGGVLLDWQPRYICWACLRLLNMQITHCAWKEMACISSAECDRRSCNVKVRGISVKLTFTPYLYSLLLWVPSILAKYNSFVAQHKAQHTGDVSHLCSREKTLGVELMCVCTSEDKRRGCVFTTLLIGGFIYCMTHPCPFTQQ